MSTGSVPFNWRDHLAVHPAAELFPRMSEAELRELADDIVKNGLIVPIALGKSDDGKALAVVDGVSRLDAMALTGLLNIGDEGLCFGDEADLFSAVTTDPYEAALSFNVQRRHLNAEQKRELIAKVLKARPEASNLQIAKQVKADDKTVAKVRTELEATSEIPKLKKTVGKDGKSRPARKGKTFAQKLTEAAPLARDSARLDAAIKADAEAAAKKSKAEHAALLATLDKPLSANSVMNGAPAEDDAAASAEARKAQYADDEKPNNNTAGPIGAEKSGCIEVHAKEVLCEFDEHVLRLLEIIESTRTARGASAWPYTFALWTTVPPAALSRLGDSLKELADLLDDGDDSDEAAEDEALDAAAAAS